jgi:hypothetical protein
MKGHRASDHFEDFAEALCEAEACASTDWEMEFVADLRQRFDRYGDAMYLTLRQADTIRRICGGT